MRAALWLLALFAIAVAVALFAGNNQGVITVFWPPYRIDFSLNFVLLILLGLFVALHAALRALAALLDLPRQAHQWRLQQRERSMHLAFLDALAHMLSGRYVRARKALESALAQEKVLQDEGDAPSHTARLRPLAHLMLAESAHSLQDQSQRDQQLQLALENTSTRHSAGMQDIREGVQLRAASWALHERDPKAALDWLDQLPQGVARRTLALRIKLKAAQRARQTTVALETARALARHRAFSPMAGQSIVRGLATQAIQEAQDPDELQRVWQSFDASERAMPELSIHAAHRLVELRGDPAQARAWLLSAWDLMSERSADFGDSLRVRLVRALEAGMDTLDAAWLARIEGAHQAQPRDANLQYLAGMACLKRQLWGKAQQLLAQAAHGLQDPGLHRNAWRALARLAQDRGDAKAAAQAWERAATE